MLYQSSFVFVFVPIHCSWLVCTDAKFKQGHGYFKQARTTLKKFIFWKAYDCHCSVQEPESPTLQKNAETGCEMADANLEETANFFMDHLVNPSKEQRVWEVLLEAMLTGG